MYVYITSILLAHVNCKINNSWYYFVCVNHCLTTVSKHIRLVLKRWLKLVIYLSMGSPSQNYRASLVVWDHTVLPAIRHR